jgi:DNA-binding LacI/PurR family transcriptional regulator
VSKVINGRADVSVETRQRVEAVIREHGYERSRKSVRPAPLLEVIFHELESDWALEIINGVENVAREHDLAVVLSEMQGRRTPGRSWLEGVLARRPTGIIAVLSDLSEEQQSLLKSRGVPLVVVDPTGEPLHDTPSIGATNWSGGLAATRHLLALGHRRIGVISGPENVLCSRARLDGYRAAMDEAGVPIDPALIRCGNFHVQEGTTEGRALLRLPDPPTAIFAGNDLQALGVYQAAREARLHIPEDLSVVGFDDLPVSRYTDPPLTTIRQPVREKGEEAARLLIAAVGGRAGSDGRHVVLATELVVRGSTAPPRVAA